MLDKKPPQYLNALFGGLLAGLSLIQINFIFMPIALSLLWGVSWSYFYSFLWGCLAVWVSHRWLLALHPLTWLGFSSQISILVAISIWFFCGILGGVLVALWTSLGKVFGRFLFQKREEELLGSFSYVFLLSLLWGLTEVYLSQSPLFWIGLGESLLPGDRWLAGMARLFGAGGLATIQLIVGWWLWRIYICFKDKKERNKLINNGIIILLLGHFFGAYILSEESLGQLINVGVWQPAISIREKFSEKNQAKVPYLIEEVLTKAKESGADFLVAPEGLLMSNQQLNNDTEIPFLTGGFRWFKGRLRSSLLVFEKGEKQFSAAVDKFRLVPLGEYIPNIKGFNIINLSALGGISPGKKNRLLQWSGPSSVISICYEISDGNSIAKAVYDGGKWILSIANLDPYPRSLQKQYTALAQLRSIETSKDLIISSNTGPTSLIASNGKVLNYLQPFQEDLGIFSLHISNSKTIYSIFREAPLILIFLGIIIRVKFIKN